MDSKYQPQLVEEKIYKEWEEKVISKQVSIKIKNHFPLFYLHQTPTVVFTWDTQCLPMKTL